MKEYAVITTINPPNKTIDILSKSMTVVVVGDKKTKGWDNGSTKAFYSNPDIEPFNSYARKNIGYLYAMEQGASVIYDTDDDNIPNENWHIRTERCTANLVKQKGWVNVYPYFSDESIWQRGLPLNRLDDGEGELQFGNSIIGEFPIQQGLVNGDPDIDAMCRMVFKPDVEFKTERSISIPKGSWSPFNSQSTWWFPKAFPLMYLPVTINFRMTDIWRSFVAQRILWEMAHELVFHSPAEVVQERNEHNLMKDFEDEIAGYLHNEKIAQILGDLKLNSDICGNMIKCYDSLIKADIVNPKEMDSLNQWIDDIEKVLLNSFY